MKRVLIATITGIGTGLICWRLMASGGGQMHWAIIANAIASRGLIGFGIGISRWNKMPWWLHGMIMGLIFSIPFAIGTFLAPNQKEPGMLFVMTLFISIIYGFIIELITSKVFKAKIG